MKEEYTTQGILLTAEFWEVNSDILNNEKLLKKAAENAVRASNCRVIKAFSHKFKPQGVSVLCFLEESHLALHTYPEHNYCSLVIYTCGSHTKPELALELFKKILKTKTVNVNKKILGRRNEKT